MHSAMRMPQRGKCATADSQKTMSASAPILPNPDRTPDRSLAQKAAAALGIVPRLLSSLTDGGGCRASRLARAEDIRRGGVVISVRVASENERSIARAIPYRSCAVELVYCDRGVSI